MKHTQPKEQDACKILKEMMQDKSRPILVAEQDNIKVFREYSCHHSFPIPDFEDDYFWINRDGLTNALARLIDIGKPNINLLPLNIECERRDTRMDSINQLYRIILVSYKTIQYREPTILIHSYRNAIRLRRQCDDLLTDLRYSPSYEKISGTRAILIEYIERISDFWIMEHSEFLFTMPMDIVMPIIDEKTSIIMSNPRSLELVLGRRLMSDWLDPVIVEWINIRRRDYVWKRKSNVLNVCFGIVGIPPEICSLIASFIRVEKEDVYHPCVLSKFIKAYVLEGRVETVMRTGRYIQNIYL